MRHLAGATFLIFLTKCSKQKKSNVWQEKKHDKILIDFFAFGIAFF